MLIKDGVNVTGSAWISGFVAPDDGDERLAAHVQVMGGMLAERTLYLKNTSINWVTGGTYNNGNIQLNGALLLYGATIATNLELTGGSWLKLSPVRNWERHSLKLLMTTNVDDDPFTPDAWPSLDSGVPAIRTRGTTSSTRQHWIDLGDLPDGGVIADVEVTLKGADSGNLGMTFPKYRVGRFKGTGVMEYLCPEAIDEHTHPNWTTALTRTLTITENADVDKSYTYVLIVTHAYKDVVSGAALILDVKVSGTVDRLGL